MKADSNAVLDLIVAGARLHDIATDTDWQKGEITRLARENGFGLNVSSDRFQRAPQAKPAPVGVVRQQPIRVPGDLDNVPVANANDRPTAAPALPTDVIRPGVRDILAEGRASENKTTQRLTEAAYTALGRLQQHLDATREKEAKAAKVRELEAELAKARAELRGEKPATVNRPVTDAVMREWAKANGVPVNDVGRVNGKVREAYALAHAEAS